MATILAFIRKLSRTLGLTAFLSASRDSHILCAARFVRLTAYAGTTLVLVLHLSALGIEDAAIGLFLTLTLLGDVLISLVLTAIGDGVGRRRVLMFGAMGMVVSGIAWALSPSYWVLLLASIIGVISPSGNEVGPFRAVEESTLAQLTPPEVRSDIFAWYSLVGSAGIALGTLICGAVVNFLKVDKNWAAIDAYHVVFWSYAVLGGVKFILSWMLSERCELERTEYVPVQQDRPAEETDALLPGDRDVQRGDGEAESAQPGKNASPTTSADDSDESPSPIPDEPKKESWWRRILPRVTAESRKVVLKLSLLFAVDSFASGLIALSWVSYFFAKTYSVPENTLGELFFVSNIIAAVSMLVAVPLSKRIGPVKTMVFTHLPSAIFLGLIPVFPNKYISMMFLVLRYCTASMDVAPRQAFLAAVVLPSERTAVMGTVNVVKTLAQSAGPSGTGIVAGAGHFWLAFIIAGSLKAIYDLSMLAMFRGYKTREESSEEPRQHG